jgi:hypothetical protein
MEGPGEWEVSAGQLKMWSRWPEGNSELGLSGHFVFWSPVRVPDSYMVELEVEVLSPDALNILFFSAQGANGEDLLDPSLPVRNGNFGQYTNGALTSYHTSYAADSPYAPGRATANLRKNNRFYLLANAPIGIPGEPQGSYAITLVKDGPHLQCFSNGKLFLDFVDNDRERFGEPWGGGGVGLRQMAFGVSRYHYFRVCELKPVSVD